MTADDRTPIDVPQILACQAKTLSDALPDGMKALVVAFDEAMPDLPLMVCNASRGATLALLRKMIVDIEKAPVNRQERRAEAAADRGSQKGPGVMEAGWGHYGGTFLPPTAPVVQRVEMKKAFYAGAGFILDALQELGTGDPAEDAALVEGVQAELEGFNAHQANLRKAR